jgi:hypothetical protein
MLRAEFNPIDDRRLRRSRALPAAALSQQNLSSKRIHKARHWQPELFYLYPFLKFSDEFEHLQHCC